MTVGMRVRVKESSWAVAMMIALEVWKVDAIMVMMMVAAAIELVV